MCIQVNVHNLSSIEVHRLKATKMALSNYEREKRERFLISN